MTHGELLDRTRTTRRRQATTRTSYRGNKDRGGDFLETPDHQSRVVFLEGQPRRVATRGRPPRNPHSVRGASRPTTGRSRESSCFFFRDRSASGVASHVIGPPWFDNLSTAAIMGRILLGSVSEALSAMSPVVSRRKLLAALGQSGAALAAGSWLSGTRFAAQSRGPARAFLNQALFRSDLDRRLLGSFLEHLGRAIYTGVYEPGSRLADAKGFRTDVIASVKGLQVPMMRYPGGNFVSGYNWLDGVGPKNKRPIVLERAWNSLETNQFGTNDFMDWCKLVSTEPLLGFNLGTGTPEMAVAYVEYCNLDKGTKWSELRRSHGYEQPHNVRYWCMGNEMDGPWQMGHMTAREYGRKARDTARQIRVIDRGLQLIACGSSNTILPTYLVWDREVLEECYDQVDGISLHNYYGNTPQLTGNSTARFLAMNLDMERQIREIAAVCDYVQGLR